jgi:hypothetical protein
MFKFYNFPDSFDITKKFLEKRLLRAELQALGNFFPGVQALPKM